jgi:hypothetical protein
MQYRKRTRSAPPESSVGYGQPPLHSRFKPGQSGNPRGRPRNSLLIDSILEKNLRKKVAVTRDGARTSVTLLAAIVEKLMVDAARGDNAARKLALQLNERRELMAANLEQARARENPEVLDPDDQAILDDFRQEILEEAAAQRQSNSSAKRSK